VYLLRSARVVGLQKQFPCSVPFDVPTKRKCDGFVSLVRWMPVQKVLQEEDQNLNYKKYTFTGKKQQPSSTLSTGHRYSVASVPSISEFSITSVISSTVMRARRLVKTKLSEKQMDNVASQLRTPNLCE
jgi:hypothetical protein